MKSRIALASLVLSLLTSFAVSPAFGHCQVPCGIYHDDVRFHLMSEHVETIEKAMKQITELSADPKANQNQLVRWTVNKESHAQKIQDIVSQYFLAQRIKLPAGGKADASYLKHLELLHQITVYSMKCKQTTDLANVAALKKSLEAFNKAYAKKVSDSKAAAAKAVTAKS